MLSRDDRNHWRGMKEKKKKKTWLSFDVSLLQADTWAGVILFFLSKMGLCECFHNKKKREKKRPCSGICSAPIVEDNDDEWFLFLSSYKKYRTGWLTDGLVPPHSSGVRWCTFVFVQLYMLWFFFSFSFLYWCKRGGGGRGGGGVKEFKKRKQTAEPSPTINGQILQFFFFFF